MARRNSMNGFVKYQAFRVAPNILSLQRSPRTNPYGQVCHVGPMGSLPFKRQVQTFGGGVTVQKRKPVIVSPR